MASIEQAQQGFEPTALRQAFVEIVEKWAQEYGYTKEQSAKLDEDISVDYTGGKGRMGIHDMGTTIHLTLPEELLNSYLWGCISYSRPRFYDPEHPTLFYFEGIETNGGEYGLQAGLKAKKQIERRIKQIEKKG